MLRHHSRYKVGELVGVGADVADAAAGARARRIGAPVGLFLAGALKRLRQPVLRVFDLNDPDRTEFTGLHQRLWLLLPGLAGLALVALRFGEAAGGIVVVGVATTGGGATLVAWLAPKGATMTTAMITTTTSRTPPIAQAIRYGRSSSRTDPGGR